jgi:hypothetical protein
MRWESPRRAFRSAALTARRFGETVEAALAMPAGPRLEAAQRLRAGGGIQRAVSAVEALRS